MLKNILFLTLLTLTCALPAQVTPLPVQQVQLEAYLADRDVDQEELRTRLGAEGIEVDRMTPAQLAAARPRIEAVIQAMIAETARETEEAEGNAARGPGKVQETTADEPSAEEPAGEVTPAMADDDPASLIYGHRIFRNKSLELYRTTDEATPPNSYPLKVGDQVSITIFGTSQEDLLLTINENGFVLLPNRIRIHWVTLKSYWPTG